jgi:hypothetical protein
MLSTQIDEPMISLVATRPESLTSTVLSTVAPTGKVSSDRRSGPSCRWERNFDRVCLEMIWTGGEGAAGEAG